MRVAGRHHCIHRLCRWFCASPLVRHSPIVNFLIHICWRNSYPTTYHSFCYGLLLWLTFFFSFSNLVGVVIFIVDSLSIALLSLCIIGCVYWTGYTYVLECIVPLLTHFFFLRVSFKTLDFDHFVDCGNFSYIFRGQLINIVWNVCANTNVHFTPCHSSAVHLFVLFFIHSLILFACITVAMHSHDLRISYWLSCSSILILIWKLLFFMRNFIVSFN